MVSSSVRLSDNLSVHHFVRTAEHSTAILSRPIVHHSCCPGVKCRYEGLNGGANRWEWDRKWF